MKKYRIETKTILNSFRSCKESNRILIGLNEMKESQLQIGIGDETENVDSDIDDTIDELRLKFIILEQILSEMSPFYRDYIINTYVLETVSQYEFIEMGRKDGIVEAYNARSHLNRKISSEIRDILSKLNERQLLMVIRICCK